MNILDRFWSKVDKRKNCWWWDAAKNEAGFGVFYFEGRMEPAHRVAYILTKGPIPAGHEVYQTCERKVCVNPKHLEAVPKAEAMARRSLKYVLLDQKRYLKAKEPRIRS